VKFKLKQREAILLGVAVAAGLVALWSNSSDSGSSTPPVAKKAAAVAGAEEPVTTLTGGAPPVPQRRALGGRAAGDFHPKLRDNRPENRRDPTKIDPTIKLDLLAKVQGVPLEGGARNIFQFGAAAPPPDKTPLPKVNPINVSKLAPTGPAPPPGPPPAPTAPPIPLKYYGFSSIKGEPRKRAFFLDGEDIIVAWEGDTVKNRYKVVHVGVNSVDMEDTQFKAKQSLPLAEDIAG
jgi:hypothetical protein